MTTPAPSRNCSSAADTRERSHVKFGQSGFCQFHVMSDRGLSLSLIIPDAASDTTRSAHRSGTHHRDRLESYRFRKPLRKKAKDEAWELCSASAPPFGYAPAEQSTPDLNVP